MRVGASATHLSARGALRRPLRLAAPLCCAGDQFASCCLSSLLPFCALSRLYGIPPCRNVKRKSTIRMRVHCRLYWHKWELGAGLRRPARNRCATRCSTASVCTGFEVLRDPSFDLSVISPHTGRVAVRGARPVVFHKPSIQQVGVNPCHSRVPGRGHNFRWGSFGCAGPGQPKGRRLAGYQP